MRVARAAASALIGVAAVGVQFERALAQTTLLATAADALSGIYLPGVEISLLQLKRSAQTDIVGEVRLGGVSPGDYRIQARLLGYKLEVIDLPFRLVDTVRVTFLMTRITAVLDTTHVTATNISPHMREFETRRADGTGHYLTEAELAAATDVDVGRLVVKRFPGLTAATGTASQGTFVFSTRGGPSFSGKTGGRCAVQVYVDGIRYGAPQIATDVSDLKPEALAGAEYYTEAMTPAKYRSGNVCGVLLLWTKSR